MSKGQDHQSTVGTMRFEKRKDRKTLVSAVTRTRSSLICGRAPDFVSIGVDEFNWLYEVDDAHLYK